jgi:redox-sensitive bicupin YhaK (pirin superfamily)
MDATVYKSEDRGQKDMGWLRSAHTFSFGGYHDPNKMGFGALRVINDDYVAPGMGFGTHPHANMEIISIPLEGDIEHQDSAGNQGIISEGDIQIMSAGTGITHSEFNHSKKKPLRFFQIWVTPNKQGVEPRHEQLNLSSLVKENEFYQVISPYSFDQGLLIHQEAWFSMGQLEAGYETSYDLKHKENGVFVMVISGKASVGGKLLDDRDGIAIHRTKELKVKAVTAATLLLIEVPIN